MGRLLTFLQERRTSWDWATQRLFDLYPFSSVPFGDSSIIQTPGKRRLKWVLRCHNTRIRSRSGTR